MKRIVVIYAVVAATALTLSGCASGPAAVDSADQATGQGTTGYPLTTQNCGMEVTVEQAPQQIVTLAQSAAEILIHLGVGDRIAGTGYEINEPPADIAEEFRAIPSLSPRGEPITHEQLLAAQPDFVYSTFGSFFTADSSGSREELHQLGVPTYASEFDCVIHQTVEGADFDKMFQEYRDLARILDVPDAGETLVAQQQATIDEALAARQQQGEPLTVAWYYSSFEGTPWVAGPGGLPQHVSELVGVKNVFDDADERWLETSWDEVAARNPDVLIIADLTRGRPLDAAAEKVVLLQSDPVTSQLDAVVNNRLITMNGGNMDASFGSVQMVPDLVKGLNGLGL